MTVLAKVILAVGSSKGARFADIEGLRQHRLVVDFRDGRVVELAFGERSSFDHSTDPQLRNVQVLCDFTFVVPVRVLLRGNVIRRPISFLPFPRFLRVEILVELLDEVAVRSHFRVLVHLTGESLF